MKDVPMTDELFGKMTLVLKFLMNMTDQERSEIQALRKAYFKSGGKGGYFRPSGKTMHFIIGASMFMSDLAAESQSPERN